MKITVLHHGFQVGGGGEKVTLSLLRALDRTSHDVALRCVHPPQGFMFCGEDGQVTEPHRGGRGGRAKGTLREGADARPPHKFTRVRLSLVPQGGGDGDGGGRLRAPDLHAEFRSLFVGTDCDLLVVTDGGFAMEKTDAPRVILYANSDLSATAMAFTPGLIRRPFRTIRLCGNRMAIRKKIALIRDLRAVVVPNSESTSRVFARRVGTPLVKGVVYPPVDLGRFERLRGVPRERRVATTGRFSHEKSLVTAARIAACAGAGWDVVGTAVHPYQRAYLEEVKRTASAGARFHVNGGQGAVLDALSRAKAYLHTSSESFGIAVVEAVAAGCVPVVPDNSAHPETVPYESLRYCSEEEAVEAVRGALDGRYDGLLPGLREHAQRFSEESFQSGMLDAIGRHGP